MRQTIKVQIKNQKEYIIDISDSTFAKLNQDINDITHGQRRLIVISKKVYQLYSEYFAFKEREIFLAQFVEAGPFHSYQDSFHFLSVRPCTVIQYIVYCKSGGLSSARATAIASGGF